jgi:uncharacterized protein YuzE
MVFLAKIKVDMEAGALYIQMANDIEKGEAIINESFSLASRGSEVVIDLNAHHELLGIEIIGIDGLLKGRTLSTN